jgi:hypothetical protein
MAGIFLLVGIWNVTARLLGGLFVVVVAAWWWQVSRAPTHPWILTIGDDEVVVERQGTTSLVRRGEVRRVRRRRRSTRHAAWTELVFEGPGEVVGTSAVDGPLVLEELRSRGWPVA